MAEIRTRSGVDVARVLTDLGALPVTALVVAAGAGYAYRQGDGPSGLALIVGLLLTVALVAVTKELWDRPRPANRLDGASSPSYPSGHTAYAMAWLATAFVVRKGAVIAVCAAVAVTIGLSRLYLHVHYMTDVVGGAALAGAVFCVVLRRV
jgi:undecaprenyl-diphosphatase